ncbi:MAG: hypothetical protein CMB20_004920 [Methanobacteriota archaeon]|nr:MAG: hypothetical protein CMB20_004920 [Euryarchaeota archaeon]|tara:strand:- start:601 stop:2046 length:1446 start_codon:yes stop_codon:yes gene_type:complete
MANSSWTSNLGGILIVGGFFLLGLFPPLGFACCFLGMFIAGIGGMQSVKNSGLGENQVKLVQDEMGQWVWKSDDTVSKSMAYNSQDNQILSRVIKEIREGKSLATLEDSELNILSEAYGITSGSANQKIEALENSEAAIAGLLLGGGAGVAATAGSVNQIPEPVTVKDKVEQMKNAAREKLGEEFDIDVDKVMESDSGEVDDLLLNQLSKEIRKRDLTPRKLIELADMDNDGMLDSNEIAGALSAATGMSIPVFIVKNSLGKFDTDSDEKLNEEELGVLWNRLGIEYVEEVVEDETKVVEEFVQEEPEITEETQSEEQEYHVSEQEHVEEEYIEEAIETEEIEIIETPIQDEAQVDVFSEDRNDLTDGIDTRFEQFIVELSKAVLSSDRRKILENQTEYHTFTLKISKFERTLLGDPEYRGGQSVHGLIDGGPFQGVIRTPKAMSEEILSHNLGSEIIIQGKISDYMPSLKRCVIDCISLL